MTDTSNAVPNNFRLGGTEPHFDSWQELVGELSAFSEQGWVFRGMSNYDYSPLSKLERVLQASGIEKSRWQTLESSSIGFFQERARALISDPPLDNDLIGWLALMQHYGAPTRLTDWTFSPLVAVFFAYESVAFSTTSEAEVSGMNDAVLWMLDAGKCRHFLGSSYPGERDYLGVKEISYGNDDGVGEVAHPWSSITDEMLAAKENELLRYAIAEEVNWPIPLVIFRPDERMSTQQACFVTNGRLLASGEQTVKESFFSTESLRRPLVQADTPSKIKGRVYDGSVEKYYHVYGRGSIYSVSSFVKKIRLPYKWRKEVFLSLSAMNITNDTIYPGLDGVGRATDIYLQSGALSMSLKSYLGL